jgi:hypothetical protein
LYLRQYFCFRRISFRGSEEERSTIEAFPPTQKKATTHAGSRAGRQEKRVKEGKELRFQLNSMGRFLDESLKYTSKTPKARVMEKSYSLYILINLLDQTADIFIIESILIKKFV